MNAASATASSARSTWSRTAGRRPKRPAGWYEPEDPAELTAARLAAAVGGVSQSFVDGAGRFGLARERIVSQANPRSAGGGPVKKS